MSKDTVYRQDVINGVKTLHDVAWKNWHEPTLSANAALDMIMELPSAQTEQTEMIKEIRKWINSGNRGNADYFIVDKIEEIINKYE